MTLEKNILKNYYSKINIEVFITCSILWQYCERKNYFSNKMLNHFTKFCITEYYLIIIIIYLLSTGNTQYTNIQRKIKKYKDSTM